MSYFQNFTLTLFTICSVNPSAAMDSVSNNNSDPHSPPSKAAIFAKDLTIETQPASQRSISINDFVIETNNPDEIYEQVLDSGTASKKAFIIDVDGTITNEEDPSELQKGQLVTPNGKPVENIRALIEQGAIVIFCSAWLPFEGTIERLQQIGFREPELGIDPEIAKIPGMTERKYIELATPNNSTVKLEYYQSGCVISVKLDTSKDYYCRNKFFSLMLHLQNRLEVLNEIEDIYFLDDSPTNHQKSLSDTATYGLFPGKNIHRYLVKRKTG